MMNKAPLMVMTALALAAGSVAAQSSLQIYGTLDASVARVKTENTAVPLAGIAAASASTTSVNSGTMTGSYIGFKGTEDLGGGMEAQFNLESYLDLDTGAETSVGDAVNSVLSGLPKTTYNTRDQGGFWSRNTYLGLKTNYGLIRLGQMDSLGYLAAGNYNPFGHAAISPSQIFYTTDYYEQGWSNTLAYIIKIGDVVAAVQHSPKESGVGKKTAAAVRYTAGPLSTSLGYEQNTDSRDPAKDAEAKSWAWHGSYDFGMAKAFAQYGSGKLDRVLATDPDVKSTGYQLGVSVPVGNGAFMASYANGKQKLSSVAPALNNLEARDITIYSVGYDYTLSKRTDVYVAYSNKQDDYMIPLNAVTVRPYTEESKTLAVGIRHRF